jgi:2-keto-4-pentenoate hydratase/2-oxohepta-3-ene-1,7-dioic acid hydratase in catechol pathway
MRLCTFSSNGKTCLGAVVGDSVIDLVAAAKSSGQALAGIDSLRQLVEAGPEARAAASKVISAVSGNLDPAWSWPLGEVTLHHPFRPRKNIVRAGGNTALKPGEPERVSVKLPPGRWLAGFPIAYYTKAPSAVLDPGQPITWPSKVTSQVYAEPQLAIIIGATIHYATAAEAMEKVFGYAVATDLSALDLRVKHGQWPKAGSLDSFFPWGPMIVTRDEVPNPDDLEVRLELNGNTCIQGSTADALLSVGEMLAEISTGILLEPGDVLLLGTPENMGFGHSPERWLADGDTVTSTIEGIGSISNPASPYS